MLPLIALALALLLSGCQRSDPPRNAPSEVRPSSADSVRAPRYLLHPGARVRVRMADGSAVMGQVLAPFTPTSHLLVMCEAGHSPCSDPDGPGVLNMPVSGLRTMAVHGDLTSFAMRFGLYSGGLAGMMVRGTWSEPNEVGMAVGMAAGAAVGALLGSRTTGWVTVFPCFHGCAHGEYPRPARGMAPPPP
jgi:hypothetical protein